MKKTIVALLAVFAVGSAMAQPPAPHPSGERGHSAAAPHKNLQPAHAKPHKKPHKRKHKPAPKHVAHKVPTKHAPQH